MSFVISRIFGLKPLLEKPINISLDKRRGGFSNAAEHERGRRVSVHHVMRTTRRG
jgi:hypothetical protein